MEEFVKYTNMKNDDGCLENAGRKAMLTDAEAKEILMELCQCDTVEGFQDVSSEKRSEFIKTLCCKGIPIRQLSRVTGISKGTIERICRE